jgi:hypothetical protein
MLGPPATRTEFFRRSATLPWIVTGIMTLVAIGAVVYFLVIQEPPVRAGGRTKTDTRMAGAITVGVIWLGFLIWAPISTKKWRVLAKRGVETPATQVSVSPLGKNGSRPVRVSYDVNGKAYTVANDEPEMFAEEMVNDPDGTRVIYDPEKPSRAIMLNPKIARLPLK